MCTEGKQGQCLKAGDAADGQSRGMGFVSSLKMLELFISHVNNA